jgi:hypothetical protein
LIKISPDLKKYVWQKLKVDKPQINIRPMNEKTNMYVVLDINITVVTTDNHMDVIQV